MIKAIIFDFDGVILESATIKTDAFAEVVQDYPRDQAEAFVQYHMSHMEQISVEILHEAYSDEKEQVLADKFSYIVFDKVMCCNYVPGAREFLEQNYRKYDFYIATGTPEEEILQILDGRNLRDFFKGVYGTPSKKEDIAANILEANHYSPQEVIFVGDAETDLKAANQNGIHFVGRNTLENQQAFRKVVNKVDDLRQIEAIIQEL